MALNGVGGSAKEALIVFQDGRHIVGRHFGAPQTCLGELVFNTAMSGYQESLTDPSYAGQILTFSYPLEGNYGVSDSDMESGKIHVRAVICREASPFYRHARARLSLHEWLSSQGVCGIDGVDTRALVRQIRQQGVVPCAVAPRDASVPLKTQVDALAAKIRSFDYAGTDYVAQVSPSQAVRHEPKGWKKHVAFVDCGAKKSMLDELLSRQLAVTVFPFNATAQQILAAGVDGVVFSNGPGDPSLMKETVATARALFGKVPVFGICLGHQIIAMALGAKTYKLKFGHRGSNHAVKNLETGKIFITSQNHGYSVSDLPAGVHALFENCNDGTNEGLRHATLPVFSCQFHPEGHAGPKDSNYLFDQFVNSL